MPETLISGRIEASEVTAGALEAQTGGAGAATVEREPPKAGGGGSSIRGLFMLVAVVGLLWVMTGGRGARRRLRGR